MKKIILILIFVGLSLQGTAQTITIDIEQQRFLGSVSSLDRSKYFNIHDLNGDEVSMPFLTENKVGSGRRFFGPFADRSFVNPIGNLFYG